MAEGYLEGTERGDPGQGRSEPVAQAMGRHRDVKAGLLPQGHQQPLDSPDRQALVAPGLEERRLRVGTETSALIEGDKGPHRRLGPGVERDIALTMALGYRGAQVKDTPGGTSIGYVNLVQARELSHSQAGIETELDKGVVSGSKGVRQVNGG
jgi:hypothetical protein